MRKGGIFFVLNILFLVISIYGENKRLVKSYNFEPNESKDWILFSGVITDKSNEVISGKFSLKGDSMTSNKIWNEFFHSVPFQLKPNGTYTIYFKYKVIDKNEGGRFYFLLRSKSAGAGPSDRAFTYIDDPPGTQGEKIVTCTLGNLEDYYLIFGIYKQGIIVIDEIKILEGKLTKSEIENFYEKQEENTSQSNNNWHQLYIPGGDYWHKRIGIDVVNESKTELIGEEVRLKIGKKEGEINIVDREVKEIRVCDANGNEFLYSIVDANGKIIEEGKIPEDAELVFPVEIKGGERKRYYVYFDNPQAWSVPEFWEVTAKKQNSGFEKDGWWEWGDSIRTTEKSYSGKASVKLEASENNTSGPFTPFLQIPDEDNFICKITFYYYAEIVKGTYFVSVFFFDKYGNPITEVRGPGDPHSHIDIFQVNSSSNGWKKFCFSLGRKGTKADFILPEKCGKIKIRGCFWSPDGINVGVVWLDDFVIEGIEKTSSSLKIKINPIEECKLKVIGEKAEWLDEKNKKWEYRIPITIMNFKKEHIKRAIVTASLTKEKIEFRRFFNGFSIKVVDFQGNSIPYLILDDRIFFIADDVPPMTKIYYYVYFSEDKGITEIEKEEMYKKLLYSNMNLVKNPDFEDSFLNWSTNWEGKSVVEKEKGKIIDGSDPNVQYELSSPGKFGNYCVKMSVGKEAISKWRGWYQKVNAKPNTMYLFSGYVKTEGVDLPVKLHAHLLNKEGEICERINSVSSVSKTNDWNVIFAVFKTPDDCTFINLNLTTNGKGKIWHDGIILCEVVEGIKKEIEQKNLNNSEEVMVWSVNPIVKVFQDSLPQKTPEKFEVYLAKNEKESLQICLRANKFFKDLEIRIDPPTNVQNKKIENIKIDMIGYVPVDFPVRYSQNKILIGRRMIPNPNSGDCDGWSGLWPDPLLPAKPFNLEPNRTQPFLITFTAGKETEPGEYLGYIKILSEGHILKKIPLKVTVWNFELSDRPNLTALFDLREGPGWKFLNEDTILEWYKFMSEYRVCANYIYPPPIMKYKNGEVTLDTEKFDKVASYYFEELKMKTAYLPNQFYSFGHAFPPKKFMGFDYPTDEFKDAYQKCLKALWEHLKEKGWEKNFILYISDEPHFYNPKLGKRVIEQMINLCKIIHEAVPDIKIYSSTWQYVPEWDGYLDVWGAGSHGSFPVKEMEKQLKKGKMIWFTTDGHMCITTRYCAIERLLPYYCFKYGVSGYEFWGFNWWTFDPFKFGWHKFRPHLTHPEDTPKAVRFPSGDGFLTYPGWLIGEKGPLSSIRLEQIREGMEDYEYMLILKKLIQEAKEKGKDTSTAEQVLQKAMDLVYIPNEGGTYSSKLLPDPDVVLKIRNQVASEILKLLE